VPAQRVSIEPPSQAIGGDAPAKKRWSRLEVARLLAESKNALEEERSVQEIADQLDMPRSTLRYWLESQGESRLTEEVADFLSTEAGIMLLNVIVYALIFVFCFKGACGSRRVAEFLVLTGLSEFVGCSVGTMHQMVSQTQDAIIDFGKEQKAVLGASMEPKEICTAQDETFFPQTCLVAIELVSNFLLLEKYVGKRDAKTWNEHMGEALADLPVTVVQCTSDEGKGLVGHIKSGLQAHHSTDLFHAQYELSKGMSAPLAAKVRKAERAVEDARTVLNDVKQEVTASEAANGREGMQPALEQCLAQSETSLNEANERLQEAQASQQLNRDAIRGLGAAYHPVSLETGLPQQPEEIEAKLRKHLLTTQIVASGADLPERSNKSIEKVENLVPSMVATLRFFWARARVRIEALGLPKPQGDFVMERLLPQKYLRKAAKKAASVEERRRINGVADKLTADNGIQAMGWSETQLSAIEAAVEDAANLFQRASSSVEGRNGHLASYHHSWRTIPPSRLAALTVVHNFGVADSDGETPAKRFFGASHPSLFISLLERLPLCRRPARRSHCPNPIPPCLAA